MFLRKCFLQWRPALLLRRRKTGKIFNFFLQFLGILGKCYARNSCLYLLDHKYEKKNSDVSSPLMKDSWVLANYSKIRRCCADGKEVTLNLLEDLLMLYIHV